MREKYRSAALLERARSNTRASEREPYGDSLPAPPYEAGPLAPSPACVFRNQRMNSSADASE